MTVLLVANVAAAQGAQSAPIDLAITYDALHTNHITAQSFWAQGGAVELGARAWRGLGIAARVEGDHAGANSTTSEPLSLVTAVFGPRYTLETRSHRYAIFGEGLVGISNGFHSLFSEGSGPVGSVNAGTTSSSNALAVDVGGGLDVRLNHRVAVRAFRASYLRTQFPNTITNAQNSLSLSAGVVVRFGR
jgi:opacity protein-like surface antigen